MGKHHSVLDRTGRRGLKAALIIALISGLISLACSSSETTTSTAPTATPAARSTPIASSTAAAPAASNVKDDTKNPLQDLTAAAAAGKPLYGANCALCHGDTGIGDGAAGAALDPKPTDLTKDNVPRDPDGKLFLAIKNGKMKDGRLTMPPANKLTDEQIWQVVAYVRTLANK
jgi:mono/diheme cytochrome c family protein